MTAGLIVAGAGLIMCVAGGIGFWVDLRRMRRRGARMEELVQEFYSGGSHDE